MEPITRNSTLLYEGLSRNMITSPLVTVPCSRDEKKQANKGKTHTGKLTQRLETEHLAFGSRALE